MQRNEFPADWRGWDAEQCTEFNAQLGMFQPFELFFAGFEKEEITQTLSSTAPIVLPGSFQQLHTNVREY